ncbi:MAG TPA: transporter substrate-binding domain-containing protein, partial [Vicinamibacterales bacterium]|nr:transporter substrate-binding domain-containing protein [Vicinamibacterales bacterium]
YDALPAESRALLDTPFTGDFDAMVKRRLIRAGVVYNRTQFFIDKGLPRGMAYEAIKLFEEELNKRLKTGLLHVHVAAVPISRDQLFPALQSGKVDFVAAALTITPERQKLANFSTPTRQGVAEIPVLAPGVPPVAAPEDLSGREVFVRRSSSYYESLESLNKTLASRGKPPVAIKEAPEALEDDDLLEMVNAGLMDITIVDDYMVEFWKQVFPDVRPQPAAAVRTGGQIAVGVRKDNPKLLRAVNIWIKEYGPRTAFGNMMERKYLENANYVKNAASEEERRKLLAVVKLFEKYAGQYSVDYLLMAAQGYQESRLDQTVKSQVGAIGVMQVMPATGKELGVGDITQVEPNIHAGVKYFRFMMDQFYKDEPMDELNKGLMTLASYNAGPGRIRQLRRETARRGLDPNRWFGNVERIVSERIGRETVQYVSNIYQYYVAYRLVLERGEARTRAKEEVKKNP